MAAECAEVGGHGIVGATLTVTEIPATSLTAAALEFTVAGTAVRASGCPPLARPFASELPGPDFAKLVMRGWVRTTQADWTTPEGGPVTLHRYAWSR